MGGERETTVCSSKDVSKKVNLGDIRIHEKEGEVHFHADSSGLKVAVPSGIWFQAWLELMDRGSVFNFVDTKRDTRLKVMQRQTSIDKIIEIKENPDKTVTEIVDVVVSIVEVEIGDNFKALHAFTMGKK